MPNLKYFTIYGNTTVYQWRTGIAPNKIEKTPIQYDFGGDEVKPTEEETTIDFGFNDEDVLVEVVNIFFQDTLLNYNSKSVKKRFYSLLFCIL